MMMNDVDQDHENEDDGDDAQNYGQVIWEIYIDNVDEHYDEDNNKFICL